MANTANSTLTTNLNVSPYYDDYNPGKNFHRIVFKPGYAVQARELTQMQTILQKQIDGLGKHLFREGSIVLPGQFGIEKDVDYVKIRDLTVANVDIDVTTLKNQTVTGLTNGIKAFIIDVADGAESDANTKTIFVRYQSSSNANTAIKTFAASEQLSTNVGTVIAVAANTTGKGSRFVISEGALFAKEHIISFPTQSVILDRYNSIPTCRVGFNITESLVQYTDDSSLLDPALESSNYQAPGADRLKLYPELQVLSIDDTSGQPDFVELFTIKDGIIQEIYDRSQYNILRDELAKRTMDESGDYYVRGLGVRAREYLDTGDNGGYLTTGDSANLAIGIEPGVGYVKGYEVGKLVTEYIISPKSLTFENVNSQISTTTMGSYVYGRQFVGSMLTDFGTSISLYDTANRRISNNLWSIGAPTGSVIGTARLQTLEHDSGVLGTANGQVKFYLTDIKMLGSNNFSNVRTLHVNNAGARANVYADVVLNNAGEAVLQDTTLSALLYYAGAPAVRSIRDTSNNPDTIFTFQRSADVTILTGGTFSVSEADPNEPFVWGSQPGGLADSDKQEIILSLNQSINIAGSGTVSGGANTTVLNGSGTAFTRLNAGDKIEIAGKSETWTISSVVNNTSLITTSNLSVGLTGNVYFKAYKTGDVIDLTTNGFAAGVERTVVTTSSQIDVDLKETYATNLSGTITYRLSRTSAREIAKTLLNSRYVVINCASHFTGANGPYSLGVPDLYKIRGIVKKTSSIPTSITDGTSVTDNFIINDGQKDTFYDHAYITPKTSLAVTDRLLVELDFFNPNFTSGRGYFGIDSYPINDAIVSNTTIRTENIPIFTSPTTGARYDLRNYLDFRPVKANTANAAAVTVSGATINPANSSVFVYESEGLRLPVPSSQITYDYSHYLARRDLVVMDKDGNYSVIQGNPSNYPVTPATPENVMALASIYVTPYPSLAPNYAQKINRKDLSIIIRKLSNVRYTMRDIGVLKNRIVNLEYYASLTALEKSAIDMQIVDENGLNRFKNGIFVDTFRDHSLGDTYNPDYRIVVDPEEKSIRPIFTMDSWYYDYISGSNVTNANNLIYLPYTETVLVEQKKATSFRNVELSSYRFIGNLSLTPDTDVWVDTEQLEDNAVSIGPTSNNLPQSSTTWNAWQTKVVGYKLINAETGKLLATFNANEKDLAYFNAYSLARNVEFNNNTIGLKLDADGDSKFSSIVETVYQNTRTGTESFSTISTSTESLGNKVVDVSLVPYIRPQTIKVMARGMKANTKLYTFFDGEDMTDYVSPLTLAQYNAWPLQGTNGAEGSEIKTDSAGTVYLALRLPQERQFRVGTKELILIDSPTNSEDDASTIATSYFVAHGLIQQKEETILNTRQVINSEKTVTQKKTTTEQFVQPLRPSCSAYSLPVKAPEGEEGLFLTSVDLYFAAKHPTLGVWVEVRAMDSAGGITTTQVPGSEIWVEAADLIVSDDASLPHTFTFRNPIFLYNNVQYAFVIHTIGLNPDTYVWVSRLGETDLVSGTQVTARPLTGTFYTTNNNLNWDMVPDIDLKITFRRAVFDTTVTGQVVIGNRPMEKLSVANVSATFDRNGEAILGNDRLTLSGITGAYSIVVGDRLLGQSSNANTTITNINGFVYTMANTYYTVGEQVLVANTAGLRPGLSANIASKLTGSGTLSKYRTRDGNETKLIVELVSSNGQFYAGDTIRGRQSGTTAEIVSIENHRYSVVDFEPAFLSFNKTNIAFEMKPTSNTEIAGSYRNIDDSSNYYFNEEQAVLSRTNEIDNLSGNRSNQVRASMRTSTEFLSPVLDLGRTHSVFVDNIINSNTLNETAVTGGQLINKYISTPITLAEGQDAEDLLVITTAYRPPGTDVKMWVKILNNEDASTSIRDIGWIELEKVADVYSSLADRDDFKEYTFQFPVANLTGPNGEIQYTNKGITYTGYKYFAIKIGLISDNSAVVPRVADLRAIALQI